MAKDIYGNEYDSKSEFKCPKCGNTEFIVTKTCTTTYPMKGVMFNNLNVEGCHYPQFIELDVDMTKDVEVDEEEDRPCCSKCGYVIDYNGDFQVNIE